MTPEKFTSEEEAVKRARVLAKLHSYVCVIDSGGKFYVENESAMVRIWERVVVRFENGKEDR